MRHLKANSKRTKTLTLSVTVPIEITISDVQAVLAEYRKRWCTTDNELDGSDPGKHKVSMMDMAMIAWEMDKSHDGNGPISEVDDLFDEESFLEAVDVG